VNVQLCLTESFKQPPAHLPSRSLTTLRCSIPVRQVQLRSSPLRTRNETHKTRGLTPPCSQEQEVTRWPYQSQLPKRRSVETISDSEKCPVQLRRNINISTKVLCSFITIFKIMRFAHHNNAIISSLNILTTGRGNQKFLLYFNFTHLY
jgi:hypothetical protein